jgi:3-hydroxyacyl-CoA dehydrogenase/enoyl-CoA hydratase/carnithine racemase
VSLMTTDPAAIFADEVVTNALVSFIDLPTGGGTFALITLDNGHDHTRPNTFGPGGLASIDAALDTISARTDVVGVGITGKPYIFAVGADLSGVGVITDRGQALAIGELGHKVFSRISDLPVPSFAFINGAVMGGGLELALSCDYRSVSTGAAAIAFPECFLGLIPGWGGTYLLPNLIGADKALKVIIENPLNQNKMLKPKQFFELGAADEIFEPADFIERSLLWAASVIDGSHAVVRPEVDKGEAWTNAVNAMRAVVAMRVKGAAPAPDRALDLVELARTATRADAYTAEDQALADLVMSDELRAGLYSFDLVQKRARKPAGAPDKKLARPVTKVGVVGAGLMASQMALLFANRLDVPVVMTDLDQERLDKGVAYAHGQIDDMQKKGRINGDRANRLKANISGSLTKDAFADAGFIIEAVFEDLNVKKKVFAEVEEFASPEAIFATNTSSLSITEMAADLKHPERVVGFHFFNPVAVMPLLEIARGEKTDDATLATAFEVGKKLKKSIVFVKDAPAFVVNRLLTRFLGEVTRAVDEGTPFEVADKALDPLGLPMTPFMLMALVGPAVAFHVSETLGAAFPDRFYVSENMRKIVGAGKGAIWDWSTGTQRLDPEIAALVELGNHPLTEEQVRARALNALAEEIDLMLQENVVADVRDIDMSMLLGAGWPFWLGGISPYLDRSGVSEHVTGHRFLPPGVATAL